MKLDIKGLYQDIKKGVRIADEVQRKTASNIEGGLGYGQSIFDPRFKESLLKRGVSARQTPAQFVGAYTSRLLVDAANDGSRTMIRIRCFRWRLTRRPTATSFTRNSSISVMRTTFGLCPISWMASNRLSVKSSIVASNGI